MAIDEGLLPPALETLRDVPGDPSGLLDSHLGRGRQRSLKAWIPKGGTVAYGEDTWERRKPQVFVNDDPPQFILLHRQAFHDGVRLHPVQMTVSVGMASPSAKTRRTSLTSRFG